MATETETLRIALVTEVAYGRAIEEQVTVLQAALKTRADRAQLAAELLGFDSLDEAIKTITEDELATVGPNANGTPNDPGG